MALELFLHESLVKSRALRPNHGIHSLGECLCEFNGKPNPNEVAVPKVHVQTIMTTAKKSSKPTLSPRWGRSRSRFAMWRFP